MSTRLQVGILSAAIALSMVGLAFSQEPAPGQGKGQFKGKGKGRAADRLLPRVPRRSPRMANPI